MPPLGFSFQPGADASQMTDQAVGQNPASAATPQQAVQIRSLRVPKVLPTNAAINRTLLTSPGSGAPGASGLTSMVKALQQIFQPSLPPSGAPEMPVQAPAQTPQPSSPAQPQQTSPTFPSQAPMPTAPPFEFQGDALGPPPNQVAFNPGDDEINDRPWEALGITEEQYNLGPSGGMIPGLTLMPGMSPYVNPPTPRVIGDNDPFGGLNRA